MLDCGPVIHILKIKSLHSYHLKSVETCDIACEMDLYVILYLYICMAHVPVFNRYNM